MPPRPFFSASMSDFLAKGAADAAAAAEEPCQRFRLIRGRFDGILESFGPAEGSPVSRSVRRVSTDV